MSEECDSCESLRVCDCCYAMVDELVDAGGHAQCMQCTRIADLESKLAAAERDAARLEWCIAACPQLTQGERYFEVAVDDLVFCDKDWREAIDTAINHEESK